MKVKSSISSFLLIACVFAIFFVMVILFSAYARYKVSGNLDIGYAASTSGNVVRLEIGDKVFNIPKNHIWSRDDWRGGKVDAVNLQALLPDFEPYTDSTRAEFEMPGWNRKITFVLNHHNTVGSITGGHSMTRQVVYDRIVYDFSLQKKAGIKEFPGPYGLVLQVLDSSSSNSDRELYIGNKKDGSFYWVTCSVDNPNRYPGCDTYLEYSSTVYVSYTFPKKYLNEWEKIDNSVYKFINDFDESADN